MRIKFEYEKVYKTIVIRCYRFIKGNGLLDDKY